MLGVRFGSHLLVCMVILYLVIQCPTVNLIYSLGVEGGEGGRYDHSMSTRIFTLKFNKDIHTSSENYKESGYGINSCLLN